MAMQLFLCLVVFVTACRCAQKFLLTLIFWLSFKRMLVIFASTTSSSRQRCQVQTIENFCLLFVAYLWRVLDSALWFCFHFVSVLYLLLILFLFIPNFVLSTMVQSTVIVVFSLVSCCNSMFLKILLPFSSQILSVAAWKTSKALLQRKRILWLALPDCSRSAVWT